MSDTVSFAGKVALVTGSSSGAGAAIALELARLGAAVAVHCRANIGEAEEVVVVSGGRWLGESVLRRRPKRVLPNDRPPIEAAPI